jgi:hypothetical protein
MSATPLTNVSCFINILFISAFQIVKELILNAHSVKNVV